MVPPRIGLPSIGLVLTVGLAVIVAAPTSAQQPIVYPAKGQSPAQQQRDQGDCQVWAKQSTGIDPVAVAQAPVPQPQGGPAVGGGERLKGAAVGAAGGAAIGAIAGDAGKGAGAGAVAGTMVGGSRARRNKRAQEEQAVAQAEGQKQQAFSTYNRAVGACMEARGYTVK